VVTRILVTGSRNWTDYDVILGALRYAFARFDGPVTVVHGDAPGADRFANLAVTSSFRPRGSLERWPANWTGPCRDTCTPGHRKLRAGGANYCPAAGNYRNTEMVAAGADLCLAFPLGRSTGTRDCMRRAKAAGIEVMDFGYSSRAWRQMRRMP
jgi:hypothetical protein